MRKKRVLPGEPKPERFVDVLKRVSERTYDPQEVTKESLEEVAAETVERAKDHAARGGERGVYEGETLGSPVLLMVDPSIGYVEGNVEVVPLGISLLYEQGFSFEDIPDFVLRRPPPRPIHRATKRPARNRMKTRNNRVAEKPQRRDDARNMATEQKSFHEKRLREHAKEQPEILELQKILLLVDGEQLVAPPTVTSDVPFLVESGFVMDYPVTERIMQPHMCHLNSVELFAMGKATGFGTGFALTEDGLWWQHSWALERQQDGTNRIIETTGKRERYFGILYWGMLGKCVAKLELQFNGVKPPASLDFLPF